MPVVTLDQLGKLVAGTVRGDGQTAISQALPLESSLPQQCITLVDSAKSLAALTASQASAAVVPVGFPACHLPLIEVAQPHRAFESIIHLLRPARVIQRSGIHHGAIIDPTADIGEGVSIAPGVTIGAGVSVGSHVQIHAGVHIMHDCVIGDHCQIFPAVVLYPGTRVGQNCILHSGCVLGANGFGYRQESGRHILSAQLGWVELHDDVELGAGVTIDRGTYGPTRIGQGTKIDNQVMIGHNCQIGRHNLICAQVGVAGSCSTGDYVVLAGQVGLKDHVHLSDRVVVAARAGVMTDLNEPGPWSGAPAMPVKDHMRTVAHISRLPEMRSEVRALQQELAQLREQLNQVQGATQLPPAQLPPSRAA